MTLKYRGISYEVNSTGIMVNSETIEGQYHGIQTKIRLPQIRKRFADFEELITYRGAKLAIWKFEMTKSQNFIAPHLETIV